MQCCSKPAAYSYAVLECDKRFLQSYHPDLHSLLEAKQLNAKVVNKAGMRPTLKLYSHSEDRKNGVDPAENLYIGNWKKEEILEYFQNYVTA